LFKSKPGEEEGERKDTGRKRRKGRKGRCLLWITVSHKLSLSLSRARALSLWCTVCKADTCSAVQWSGMITLPGDVAKLERRRRLREAHP
jgi:hypothetical protein